MYLYQKLLMKNGVISSHWSPDTELLNVNCRPFYLPREFSFHHCCVCFPSADTNEAMRVLYQTISELQSIHTEGFFIVTGDFNQVNMKSVPPHFHQYVDCATRGVIILDFKSNQINFIYIAQNHNHIASVGLTICTVNNILRP